MKTVHKNVSRRNFLKASGLTGAALTIGYYLPAAANDATKIIHAGSADTLGVSLNAWVSIDSSGKVTIMNHRSEMGQGSFQVVPQMIAEELEVDLDKVQILFAPGSQDKYGSQITGGSSTVRGSYLHLMRVGASAREMLIQAAAKDGMSTAMNVMPKAVPYSTNLQGRNSPTGSWWKTLPNLSRQKR